MYIKNNSTVKISAKSDQRFRRYSDFLSKFDQNLALAQGPLGQSQKYFFKAIYYIARGLCPNFSPLGPILKEEIGNKGIKWPLLYIYTRKKPGISRVLTAFPGIFHAFPGFPSSSYLGFPGVFDVPGDCLSWGISCPGGFLVPGVFLSRGFSCPEALLGGHP